MNNYIYSVMKKMKYVEITQKCNINVKNNHYNVSMVYSKFHINNPLLINVM